MAFFEDNSITHSIEPSAAFRAWASKIHEALEKVGLVNTSDTGQINLATVERPTVSTFAGYEIWRFNDAKQSEWPIYFKIEYGVGAIGSRPSLRMTVGRGSDGAGTLTTASESRVCIPTGTPIGNGYIHACLHEGAFHLLSCPNTATTGTSNEAGPIMFIIERPRLATTLALTDGIFFIGGAANGALGSQLNTFNSGTWKEAAGTSQAVSIAGTQVQNEALSPGYRQPILPLTAAPLRAVLGAASGAIGSGDKGELSVAGLTSTYLRAPIGKETNLLGGGAEGASAVTHNYLLLHQ